MGIRKDTAQRDRRALPRLTTFSIADYSTLHITLADSNLLEAHAGDYDYPQDVMRYEFGYIVSAWHWCTDNALDPEEVSAVEQKLLTLGHSEAYINACRLAGRSGCKWACFDMDGSQYDYLPDFNW